MIGYYLKGWLFLTSPGNSRMASDRVLVRCWPVTIRYVADNDR